MSEGGMAPEERETLARKTLRFVRGCATDAQYVATREEIELAIRAAEREAAEREREACCQIIEDYCVMHAPSQRILGDPVKEKAPCGYCGRPIAAIRARGGKS